MSKRKKLLILLGLLCLAAAGLVKWKLDAMEADAVLLADTGRSVIAVLKEYATGVKTGDTEAVLGLYAAQFDETDLVSHGPEPLPERDGVQVAVWNGNSQSGDLSQWIGQLTPAGGVVTMAKFKLGLIEDLFSADHARAKTVLWLRGERADGLLYETQLRFRMDFKRGPEGWAIHTQELIRGKTVYGDGMGFADVAAQAGIDFQSHNNPAYDTEEWNPKRFGLYRYSSSGVSTADYDGDGWFDLFYGDGKRPRLYKNNGDGGFVDATVAAGLPADLEAANTAVFADFDNDGDQDLFLGRLTGLNALYENNGDGTFTDVTEGAGLGGTFVTVGAAADYDLDGDLDLYIGRYLDPRKNLPTTLFYTRNGEGNSLLRNDGEMRFTDVTQAAGVREGGLTLGVSWGDYDNDGYPDLYVANDFGRNALLRNNGDGTFEDVSAAAGVLDFGFGMSATFGDIDNDGDLDIYTSNVHSGQRWYGQAATLHRYLFNSMRQGTWREDMPLYREILAFMGTDWQEYGDLMVKGNSLFLNNGDGTFREVAEQADANPFGWYWGSTMFDYDNDGRQDLYAANGWISGETVDDL